MANRYYYAMSDSFTGDYPREYTHGFANTKIAIAFQTYADRAKWLAETKLLTARKITRREALKMSEKVVGGGDYDVEHRVYLCGSEHDYVIISGRNY